MPGGTSDPDAIADDLDRFVERIVKGIAAEFVHAVRERNPVDTGHSRANWITTGGAPYSGVLGIRSHAAGAVNDALPNAALSAVLASYTLASGNIYVTNNVDYVPKLNASHPTARGYVDLAVMVAVNVGISRAVAL